MLAADKEKSDGWTEDRIQLLKKLWLEGLSATKIAEVLGEGVTRNGVIGKVHRLKLARRKTVVRTPRKSTPRATSQSPRLGRKRDGSRKPPMSREAIEKVVEKLRSPAPEDTPGADKEEGQRLDYSLTTFRRIGLVDSYRNDATTLSVVVGDRGPQLPPEERCNFMSAGAAGSRCIHRKEKKRPYCGQHRDSQPMETGARSSLGGFTTIIKPR